MCAFWGVILFNVTVCGGGVGGGVGGGGGGGGWVCVRA